MPLTNLQLECNSLSVIVHSFSGNVTGQFTAPSPTCPGDTFTFRCNVTGDMRGITIWRVGIECILTHSTTNAPTPCGSGSPFMAATGTGFGTSATSFISTLSGTAVPALNGTLVECFGPTFSRNAWNMIGNGTLQIIGQLYLYSLTHSVVQYPHYGTLELGSHQQNCRVHDCVCLLASLDRALTK